MNHLTHKEIIDKLSEIRLAKNLLEEAALEYVDLSKQEAELIDYYKINHGRYIAELTQGDEDE